MFNLDEVTVNILINEVGISEDIAKNIQPYIHSISFVDSFLDISLTNGKSCTEFLFSTKDSSIIHSVLTHQTLLYQCGDYTNKLLKLNKELSYYQRLKSGSSLNDALEFTLRINEILKEIDTIKHDLNKIKEADSLYIYKEYYTIKENK